MRKSLLFLLFLISSLSVLGITAQYSPYMSVNESYKLTVTNGGSFNESTQVNFIIEGSPTPMVYDSDTDSFSIYVSSDVEEDVNFEIIESSNESEAHSGGDNIATGEYEISTGEGNANEIVAFSQIYNTSIGVSTHTSLICANLRVKNLDRHVIFTVGRYNGTHYNRYNSTSHLIDDTNFGVHCEIIEVGEHNHTLAENITAGLYCTDCDTNGIYIETDTNVSKLGLSSTIDLDTNVLTVLPTLNFEILNILSSEFYTLQYSEGVLQFRIPYNLIVKLYKDNTTSYPNGQITEYCNSFSNIFMVDYAYEDSISGFNIASNVLNGFFEKFDFIGLMPTLGYDSSTVEYGDVYFNGVYSNCQSNITLYELGNYSIYLVGSKMVLGDSTEFFTNPTTGKESFVAKITGNNPLEITEKQDYELDIFTSDWEISKTWTVFNILKWVLITIIPALLIFIITHPQILLTLVTKK